MIKVALILLVVSIFTFQALIFVRLATYYECRNLQLMRVEQLQDAKGNAVHWQLTVDQFNNTFASPAPSRNTENADLDFASSVRNRITKDAGPAVHKYYYEITECSDPVCFSYLTEAERAGWHWCANKTLENRKFGALVNGSCRFMNGSGRSPSGPVALTSQPGSGNTWIRCLLERATGICTGQSFSSPQLIVFSVCQ